MIIRRLALAAVAASVVLLVLLTMGSPTAKADTITIGSCTSCGIPGPYATVTLTQDGSNVDVVVQADSGFTLKTGDSSDVYFNPTVTLTANSIEDTNGTVGTVSSNGPILTGLSFGVSTNQNVDGLGTFAFDMTGIGTSQVGSTSSVASYDFTILNVTVAELEGVNSNGYSWGAHICDTSGNCTSTTPTFFAAAPEPSTAMLLGVGLLALIALGAYRRRSLAV